MEKLSKNEERIWKVLSMFSDGARAKKLQSVTAMSKTIVYKSLKGLESKGFADHKKGLYITKGVTKEKPPRRGDLERFWRSIENRHPLEQLDKLESYASFRLSGEKRDNMLCEFKEARIQIYLKERLEPFKSHEFIRSQVRTMLDRIVAVQKS